MRLQRWASWLITLAVILAPLCVHASDQYVAYTVNEGDTLSSVLKDKFKLSPVYGPNGYVRRTVSLNAAKTLEDGDLIWPGDVLLIPAVTPEALQYAKFVPILDPVKLEKVRKLLEGHPIANETPPVAAPTPVPMPVPTPLPTPTPTPMPSPTPQPTPPPRSKPAPQAETKRRPPAKKTPAEFTRHTSLDVSVGSSYFGLFGTETSNGTSAHLLSGISPEVDVAWLQRWTPRFTSRLYVNVQRVDFESDETSVAIENGLIVRTTLGVGLRNEFSPTWAGILDLESEPGLFYSGSPSGDLIMNVVPIIHLHPQAEYAMAQLGSAKFSVLGGLSYYGASSFYNYSIQTGFGYDGWLKVTEPFEHSEIHCKIGYSERDQNTSLLNLVQREMGLQCGFTWDIK